MRRRTKSRIRLENYVIYGDPYTRPHREKFLKFALTLQAELLHHENWDCTPRS